MKTILVTLLLASLISLTACDNEVESEVTGSGDFETKVEAISGESIDISKEFILDNENKYLLTTDLKWKTMQNDGGSHTNTYYQIDLNTGIVRKCEDNYIGFQGYEYEGKELNMKNLDENQKSNLQTILDSIITNIPEEDSLNYNYYELTLYSGDTINIYDEDTKNTLLDILE